MKPKRVEDYDVPIGNCAIARCGCFVRRAKGDVEGHPRMSILEPCERMRYGSGGFFEDECDFTNEEIAAGAGMAMLELELLDPLSVALEERFETQN